MAYTETTHESFGSRILDSLKGLVIGLALLIAGIALLFWNEGRTIKRTNALNEAGSECVSISADEINPENEGKLVHLSADAETEDILTDPEFQVSVQGFSLNRSVEMYQWVEDSESETKTNLGGSQDTTTTYTYKKEWCSHLVDSSTFKESGHDNPTEFPFNENTYLAKNASFGAFRLSQSLIALIGPEEDYVFPTDDESSSEANDISGDESQAAPQTDAETSLESAPPQTDSEATNSEEEQSEIAQAADGADSAENPAETPAENAETNDTVASVDESAEQSPNEPAQVAEAPAPTVASEPQKVGENIPAFKNLGIAHLVHKLTNGYYIGNNPLVPQVGDIKITYTYVSQPKTISVISQQKGETFTPFTASNGNSVELLESGNHSMELMFAHAHSQNKMIAWLIRVGGIIVIAFGLSMVTAPLAVVASVIPFLGSLISGITGVASFLMALSIGMITIAIAWLWYRPIMGITLLVVAGAVLVLALKKAKNAKK